MEKNVGMLLGILAVLCLLVGFSVGYIMAPDNCPECPTCPVQTCPDCPVTECEVCETETVTCETVVCEDTANELLDVAIADLMDYLEDEDELVCDDEEFDRDEVEVRKIYDEFSVDFDDDEYTVFGKVKLNYKQEDEKRCRDVIEFSVFYEPDEEPEIEAV
jgi:hypothetical protein